MNIAKTLKAKSQLVNKINKLKAKIKHNNSTLKGNEKMYDIKTLLQELETKTEELVQLKTKLTQANAAVQDKIYKIGELKSMIAFYKEMSVRQGKTMESNYNTTIVEYEAQVTQKDKDEAIEKLETEIMQLQDELDTFNYTTILT